MLYVAPPLDFPGFFWMFFRDLLPGLGLLERTHVNVFIMLYIADEMRTANKDVSSTPGADEGYEA